MTAERDRSFCELTQGRGGKMIDLSEMMRTDKGNYMRIMYRYFAFLS